MGTATLGPMRNWLGRVSPWVTAGAWTVFMATASACRPTATGTQTGDQARSRPAKTGGRMTEGKLRGIDTSQLTSRERSEWWTQVSELLAPCPDQPVSIAQCVDEKRPCSACVPAAEFLVRQVTLGKTRAQIERAFGLRFDADSVKPIDVDGAPFKGPRDAPVTIVEWADFECPFCALASPYLDYLVKAFPGQVRVVFKHFPISYHTWSVLAARAAVAAHRQGKFWPMHNGLFANRESLDEATILHLAQQIGLDMDRFKADMTAQTTLDTIERDRREADELGLRGTPMIYVNGRYFDLQDFDLMQDLLPWIETEIEITTKKRAKPQLPPPDFAHLVGTTPVSGDVP